MAENTPDTPKRTRQPKSREPEKLAEALRENLRRRKLAGKNPSSKKGNGPAEKGNG